MDGRSARAVILSIALLLTTLSAQAEGVFGIAELNNTSLVHKCYAVHYRGQVIAPAHCFVDSKRMFLTNTSNPVIGVEITEYSRVAEQDAVIISTGGAFPPIGESSQGRATCLTLPSPKPEILLHNCVNLRDGDSGSLITSGNERLMHLGAIYFSGKSAGFGLKYMTIINSITK